MSVKMVPLISRALYERAATARQEMITGGVGNPAQVFVPVGAPLQNGQLRMPRVLYIGKATRDFGESELGGFDGGADGAATVVDEWLLSGKSPFWQFIRAVLREVAARCDQSDDARLVDHLAWSNLAKIGDLYGNPGGRSLKAQQALCAEALAGEITTFQPTAVILATKNYAQDEILFPVFDRDGWSFDTEEQDRVAYKQHPQHGLVVWTNHPQGMQPSGTRKLVQHFVADLILKHWRGEPMPQCVVAGNI